MTLPLMLNVVLLLAFASYFQTVSGFGLSMIVIGLNAVLGWLSLPQAAVMVSVATIASSALAVRGQTADLPRAALRATLWGMVPAVLAGIWLLHRLAAASSAWLQALLGMMIVYGSLNLFLHPRRRQQQSPLSSFVVAGWLSGLMGGLFAVAGPPLIYHCYRQPWQAVAVRAFLITSFAILALLRLAHDLLLGYVGPELLGLCAMSVPAVLAATWAGRRTAHLYTPGLLRGVACVVLLGIGAHLMAQAWPALLQQLRPPA